MKKIESTIIWGVIIFQFIIIFALIGRVSSLAEIQRLDGSDLDCIKEKLHIR